MHDVGTHDMTELTIREPLQKDAEQLAAMLCEDEGLRRDLGMAEGDRPTAEGFLRHLGEWCRQRRATTFAIVVQDAAIGMISLSHRSPDGLSARIGYWVGSDHRRLGYCTRAFAAVLARAASEGIVSVSATIEIDNIASRRLWERQGAVATPASPTRLRYELTLGCRQSAAVDAPRSATER